MSTITDNKQQSAMPSTAITDVNSEHLSLESFLESVDAKMESLRVIPHDSITCESKRMLGMRSSMMSGFKEEFSLLWNASPLTHSEVNHAASVVLHATGEGADGQVTLSGTVEAALPEMSAAVGWTLADSGVNGSVSQATKTILERIDTPAHIESENLIRHVKFVLLEFLMATQLPVSLSLEAGLTLYFKTMSSPYPPTGTNRDLRQKCGVRLLTQNGGANEDQPWVYLELKHGIELESRPGTTTQKKSEEEDLWKFGGLSSGDTLIFLSSTGQPLGYTLKGGRGTFKTACCIVSKLSIRDYFLLHFPNADLEEDAKQTNRGSTISGSLGPPVGSKRKAGHVRKYGMVVQ